ncbi:hypothetical protein P7K49_025419 [Saguinus oedipus]|uniref:Uncharacterized protein n=1 Tax=Saguinus oedipus TaxID=9490 RepID=A0ABQ9UHX5_SAGOE|nr:hypothetical protein P7K49_025419 [Saguinus oedipus]
MVLETLVVVAELVSVGMTTLVMEETSGVVVALLGIAMMDLVMMVVIEEAALFTLEEADTVQVGDRGSRNQGSGYDGSGRYNSCIRGVDGSDSGGGSKGNLGVVEAVMIFQITRINL